MSNTCPYCQKDISGFVRKKWALEYPFTRVLALPRFYCICPECNKELGVEIIREPYFFTYKKGVRN